MNRRLEASALFLVLCMLLTPNRVIADDLFIDTFEDGSATDGSPVTWTPHPNPLFQGRYQVDAGDYVISTIAVNDVAVTLVPEIIVSDVSIRAQVRMTGSGETGLLARGNATDETAYSAGIMTDGRLYLGWSDPTFHYLGQAMTDLRVLDDDVFLQLDVIGNRLALYAWRAIDPMPLSPRLTAVDNRYSSGIIGYLHWTQSEPATSRLEFVHVADAHIPEPSSLVLSLLGVLLARGVRRHSRGRT